MNEKLYEILMNLNRGRITVSQAKERLIGVFTQPGTGWQLCLKCNGDGHLGRYNSPNLTNAVPTCDVCNGKKIISIFTGLPPI